MTATVADEMHVAAERPRERSTVASRRAWARGPGLVVAVVALVEHRCHEPLKEGAFHLDRLYGHLLLLLVILSRGAGEILGRVI